MDLSARNLNKGVLVWMLIAQCLARDQPIEPAMTEDYCMSEPFQPHCAKTEVLLMTSATYGRMRIGRCIPAEEVEAHRSVWGDDPRYLGCSTDVLRLMHRKCSGLPECDIRLSEISANNVKPCFPGLTVYLDVSYQCVNVADDERSCALVASADPIRIISSAVSRRTCGTRSQPWLIEAPVGQRLRIGRLDFTSSSEDNTRGQGKDSCTNYGVIVDKSARRNVSICGDGEHGSTDVYISRGNEVEITLDEIDTNEDAKRFMMIIASIGCSDLIPPEDAWIKRSEDTIVIGCYASRQTWHLNCLEGNWVGVFGNCSQGLSADVPVPESELIKTDSWTDGQVLAMVSIGGLTVAVCIAISCAGIICFRRSSVQKQKHPEYRTINYTMTSTRRQQMNETNSQNTATAAAEGNGSYNFDGQQIPSYSVFVGENGINDVA